MNLTNKITGLRENWHFENRWQLILSRLLFTSQPVVIFRLAGMSILVDYSAGDGSGAREVLISPMYRQYLRQMTLQGPINVLDMGANGGGFPLLLRSQGIALKKVVCVELNPNTCTRLRFNVERNLPDISTVLNAGVCGEMCTLDVPLGTGSSGDTIYERTVSAANGRTRMYHLPGRTFDSIYESEFHDEIVDVCKMDIEGAEYDVLSMPHHNALARCRYLIIEIHHDRHRPESDAIREIERLGFVELPKDDDSVTAVHAYVNTRLQR